MERLTEHHVNKTLGAYMVCSGACIDDNFDCNGCKKLEEMVDRLAAYEDTGLEPEEIEFYREAQDHTESMSPKRFIEIAQAEKDGRLVVLPFRVGASLYEATRKGVQEYETEQFCIFSEDLVIHALDKGIGYRGGRIFCKEQIGKTVFLTREEAEAALKKREADNETD